MADMVAVVDQATTALHKVKDYIDNGMDSTLEIISDIIQQEKDAANTDIENKIGEMRDVMYRYAKSDDERTRFLLAIEHAKKFVRDGGDIMEMENELDKKLAELQVSETVSPDDHPKVQEMAEKIQELLQQHTASQQAAVEDVEEEAEAEMGQDDDIAVMHKVTQTKCPYTGMDMVRPMRNKHCGHHYDYAGFKEMCKKRARPKCPIPGCKYQNTLTMDDVEEDLKLKALIKAKKTKS